MGKIPKSFYVCIQKHRQNPFLTLSNLTVQSLKTLDFLEDKRSLNSHAFKMHKEQKKLECIKTRRTWWLKN